MTLDHWLIHNVKSHISSLVFTSEKKNALSVLAGFQFILVLNYFYFIKLENKLPHNVIMWDISPEWLCGSITETLRCVVAEVNKDFLKSCSKNDRLGRDLSLVPGTGPSQLHQEVLGAENTFLRVWEVRTPEKAK